MVCILLTLLLAILACNTAHGCMCFKGHHQEQFCKANYVIRGQVVNVTNSSQAGQEQIVIHTVNVINVFKDDSNSIKEGTIIKLQSNRNSLQCGIQLSQGEYLLGGIGGSSGLRIGLCDTVTEWKYVPECQRNSLINKLYDCGCQITPCGANEVCQSSSQSCKMAFPVEVVDNAYCTRFRGRCRWQTCPSSHDIFNTYFLRTMIGLKK